MSYVKLILVEDKETADKKTQEMGWDNDKHFEKEVGASLIDYWIDDGSVTELPNDSIEDEITPICIIVHSRLFPEQANGWKSADEKIAYIEDDIYENLF